jgi:hypothetical protein
VTATGRAAGWLLRGLVVAAFAAAPAAAEQGPSPDQVPIPAAGAADTTLGGFLRILSDSTDRYFGLSAAPPDTTGQDSALAFSLAHPSRGVRRSPRLGLLPRFAFNRVEGPVWGGGVSLGEPRRLGRVTGTVGYAAGPNRWRGSGGYEKTLERAGTAWTLKAYGGRWVPPQNRDDPERVWGTLRALVAGTDYQSYLRRDGVEAGIRCETTTLGLFGGYRDVVDAPVVTTATWNLLGRRTMVTGNPPAAAGRLREFGAGASWRLPGLPVTAEAIHQTSGHAIGSDFEYRRTRVALAGNFGLGRLASVVPQLAYGRLTGTPVPQAVFYLGGPHTLRTLVPEARAGTAIAIARLDLIGASDVLALAHLPHPAFFPLQLGLFGGVGAVWGVDPRGGPGAPGAGWPHRDAWLGEAGVSAIYQPGFPDPAGLLRLDLAWPLGPGARHSRWSLAYTVPLDLLGSLDR